ncbi:restriction endonuclease subunit S domain-containing protein [Calditrichota bacterium LG25]
MECLTIDYSYTQKEDGTFRLDAEHYRKKYLDIRNKLLSFGAIQLKELIIRPIMTGHTPSMKREEYYGGKIKFIKTDNLREFNITENYTHMLTDIGNEIIKRSALKENDIIVTIIGATYDIVGRACLIQKKDLPANINQNIALIRVSKRITPEFLTVYLNTYYGRNYLWFLSRQTEQVNLNCREIEKLLVPKCSDRFQLIITNIYEKSFSLIEKSKYLYQQAQTLLLSELGLLDWQPKHQLSFIKNFSDTQKAGRIDAEYFQPKYEEIIEAIKSYSGGWDTLGNLVSVKKCVEVGSDEYLNEGIPFIRVSNLSPFEITEEKYISEELYLKLSEHQPQKGEILLSKDATPGIAYYINEEPKKMIPSGGILRLKLIDNSFNEETLTTILNSLIVQEQIKRDVVGSVILHWRPDQVKNTLIPILSDPVQEEIKQKIIESFNLRKQSKHLLEAAKRAVEIGIEEGEDTAMEWLNKEVEGADA